jgi:hypothetical protein
MNDIHVISSKGRWAVKKPEMRKASKIVDTVGEAIREGLKTKRRVIVHRKDGTVERIIEPQ